MFTRNDFILQILRDKDYSNDDPGLDNTINKVYTVEEKPDVTCARCNKSIPNIKWSAHKLKHNNLAWNNEEDPIVYDSSFVA